MSVLQASSFKFDAQMPDHGLSAFIIKFREERKGVSERDIPQATARHSKNDAVLYK